MSRLYKIRYEVLIGDNAEYLRLTNENDGQSFRVVFAVQHDYGAKMSYAEISIFGLKEATEARIFEKYRTITLQAGFRELFGPIFKGQIINVQHDRTGPGGVEKSIRLFCRSGGKELDQSFINITFGPNTPYTEIIRACATKFGYPVVFVGDFSAIPNAIRGYVLHGGTKSALDKLAKTHRFKWIIENGVLNIVKDGYVKEGEVFKFSSRTGMIGSPIITDTGVNVRVALNPALFLGRMIEIESIAPQFEFSGAYWYEVPRSIGEGQYEIARMNHVGDTHSPNLWETQIECFRYNKAERDATEAKNRELGIL